VRQGAEDGASGRGARRVGLRRIDWIRLVVADEQVAAEAVGVGFRLPVTCPITLSLAAELIAAGTPHVMRYSQVAL
jgi:hypothetical protein